MLDNGEKELRHTNAVIDSSAVVSSDVTVGEGVRVGCLAVIESGVSLGSHAVIGPRAYIGHGVSIGEGAVVEAGAVLNTSESVLFYCFTFAAASKPCSRSQMISSICSVPIDRRIVF